MAARQTQARAGAGFGRMLPGLLAFACLASAAVAAPVLSSDDSGAGADASSAGPGALPGGMNSSTGQTGNAVPAGPMGSTGPTGLGGRATPTAGVPEASTGNKNLDLLLELQGRPGEDVQRPAAPRSAAAASAAAAALAELRAKAAQRPAPDGAASKPLVQPFEGTTTIDGDARGAQPAQRREWSGQPGTAGGGSGAAGYGSGGGGGGGGGDLAEPDRSRGGFGGGGLLYQLPRAVIEFMRENRYWLLGTLAALVAVGAALKAYSRRV